jgi:hypothetical protein
MKLKRSTNAQGRLLLYDVLCLPLYRPSVALLAASQLLCWWKSNLTAGRQCSTAEHADLAASTTPYTFAKHTFASSLLVCHKHSTIWQAAGMLPHEFLCRGDAGSSQQDVPHFPGLQVLHQFASIETAGYGIAVGSAAAAAGAVNTPHWQLG